MNTPETPPPLDWCDCDAGEFMPPECHSEMCVGSLRLDLEADPPASSPGQETRL